MTHNVSESSAMAKLFAKYEPGIGRQTPRALPPGLRIRNMHADDALVVAQIIQQRDGGSIENHLQRLTSRLARGESHWHTLVATVDDVLAAYAQSSYFVPPPDSPANIAPKVWYLAGLTVAPMFRRRGIGLQLTQSRLAWLASRCTEVYYFASAQNLATIDLHAKCGFVEVTRDLTFPESRFTGGVGILFRCRLRQTSIP